MKTSPGQILNPPKYLPSLSVQSFQYCSVDFMNYYTMNVHQINLIINGEFLILLLCEENINFSIEV